jgi:hypothetical protein
VDLEKYKGKKEVRMSGAQLHKDEQVPTVLERSKKEKISAVSQYH